MLDYSVRAESWHAVFAMAIIALVRTDPFYGFLYMLVSLFTLGLVLGYLDPARGMLWGAITGLPMIALSFVEGFLGRSHSLWGTEVALYTVFTLPAILGGLLGRLLKRARLRWTADRRGGP